MRYLKLIALIFILSISSSEGQVIVRIKIIDTVSNRLNFYSPIYKKYYNNKIITKSAKIISNKWYADSFAIDNPLFIQFTINDFPIYLFVEPKDSINVILNMANLKNSSAAVKKGLNIDGKNGEGNLAFNYYQTFPYSSSKYLPIKDLFVKVYSSSQEIINSVNKVIENETSVFDSLYFNKKITGIFYYKIKKVIPNYLVSEALKQFLRPTKYSQNYTPSEKEKIINELFKISNPLDSISLECVNTIYYAADYFDNVERRYKNNYTIFDVKDSLLKINDKNQFLIERSYVPKLHVLDRNLQEQLWGNSLLSILNLYSEPLNSDDINAFRYYHPNSIFNSFLATTNDKMNYRNGFRNVRYDSEYFFLDTTQSLQSLNKVYNNFLKGKKVYIDIWATWCIPCKIEFKENNIVDSFLQKNNISKLYISLDDIKEKGTWKNDIKKFALFGYHIIANQALINNLKELLYSKDEMFTIPRYAIIDDKGNLVNVNAPKPSNTDMLIQQLKRNLNILY